MTTNAIATTEDRIQLTLSDLTGVDISAATGGKLQDDQSSSFYQKLIEASPLLSDIRTIQMNSDTMNINKISLANQILYPASAGTSPYQTDTGSNSRNLAAASRFSPAFDKVTLTAKEYIAEVMVTDDIIDNNLAKDALPGIILDMAAQRISRDIQNLIINGDTASGNSLLATANGMLKFVTSNVVATAGVWGAGVAANAIKALPEAYADNLDQYKFYLNRNIVMGQKVSIANRQTIMGDRVLVDGTALSILGQPVVALGGMPADKGVLINPKQIILGVQRDMRVETERFARARATSFIFTIKFGIQHEHEAAATLITGITG